MIAQEDNTIKNGHVDRLVQLFEKNVVDGPAESKNASETNDEVDFDHSTLKIGYAYNNARQLFPNNRPLAYLLGIRSTNISNCSILDTDYSELQRDNKE